MVLINVSAVNLTTPLFLLVANQYLHTVDVRHLIRIFFPLYFANYSTDVNNLKNCDI